MAKDSVILERSFVPAGKLILREGEEGNCAYLIQSGSVKVYTEHNGKKVELAKLGVGQIFGELALIFDEPRTASVQALEDCNLIVITRSTLNYKMERSDPTIQSILEMLTQRIITTNNSLLRQKSDIEDLTDTTRVIYQNILTSLPRVHQKEFQSSVLPKLDAFLETVRGFQAAHAPAKSLDTEKP